MTHARHIDQTITDLEWLVTIPHTIDQIIAIHAQHLSGQPRPMRHGLTVDEILSSLTSRLDSSSGKGGHSDPTAMAALWRCPGDDPDETLGTLNAAVELAVDTSEELGQICADTLGNPARWIVGRTRTDRLADTIAQLHYVRPMIDQAAAVYDDPTHLETLLRDALADNAKWLRGKAEGIWNESQGDRMPAAVQRTITECTNCAKWRNDARAVDGGLCEKCRTFRDRHKCQRTEAIVRRDEMGKAPTPGQIAEAKAATKVKRGRSRVG